MAVTKLVVIGGVAGGASAAARARRLSEDAKIVVFERGPFVSFANCGLPYHIGNEIADRDALLLQTPQSLRARHNLDVRVRSEVIAIDRDRKHVEVRNLDTGETYREPYDKLIISTGAAPIRPPLPGIEHEKIFTLRNIPDMDRIKAVVDAGAKSAVVIGGGFIGLEMAENLRRRGLSVSLVEMLPQVMPPLDVEMATPIHQELVKHRVDLRLGDGVKSFADVDGRVAITLQSGATLTAELVILSIGVRPDSKLAGDAGLELSERGAIKIDDRMVTSDADILAVGDAVQVSDFVTADPTIIPLAGPANRQGRIAADNVFGRDSRYRGTQGTSAVRVFDLTIAMTGASEKTLQRAGIDHRKSYIHPSHHVGYFPGAALMHIKLLWAPEDGRVLGCQIVGSKGVDKRIDVVAMAIQAGLTVRDLEEAELAYAPPYGAAKDPVNMIGFVAANELRGDVDTVYANELDEALVLDVREPAEHEAGAIAGSTLIPLNSLRERHGELPKDRRIVAYCKVGMRGYLAARILKQLGYDVANLSGGFTTYRMYFPPKPVVAPSVGNGESRGGPADPPPEKTDTATTAPPATTDAGQGNASAAQGSADVCVLDVRGLQCPGPIVQVSSRMKELAVGETIAVLSSDPGFALDIPAWCETTGNRLVEVTPVNGHFRARIRKGAIAGMERQSAAHKTSATGKTIVVFSSDLDKVMAAFIIANGAASMDQPVTLFFTFWGLNALRRPGPQPAGKSLIDRMFGWMMPKGADRLHLSRMNMGGMGLLMMKKVMRDKNVQSLPELIKVAQAQGVRFVACSMSMDVMGIRREELIDGVEVGGVGAYLAAADKASANLFI